MWWLAWMALCCSALGIVHIVWPRSLVARGVLASFAGVGSALTFGLRRRRGQTRTSPLAIVIALVIFLATVSTLIGVMPPFRYFLR
jgi:hypothetical protein